MSSATLGATGAIGADREVPDMAAMINPATAIARAVRIVAVLLPTNAKTRPHIRSLLLNYVARLS